MLPRLLGAVVGLAVAGTVTTADALLIKSDLNIFDDATGLTWLHHSAAAGLSYDYVVQNLLGTGQELFGWRYASGDEASSMLISNFGFAPGYNLGARTQENVDRITALTAIFGDIVDIDQTTSGILGVVKEFSDPPQANYLSIMGSYYYNIENYYSIMEKGHWTISSSNSQSYYSHFLVTDEEISAIPLPAAFPLFATALAGMGLLGWRRKRKASA